MDKINYSAISWKIYLHFKDGDASRDKFFKLIAQSYEYIIKNPNKSSIALHNKHLELGKSRYGNEGISDYVTTSDLLMLESEFEKDPSDMSTVVSLAIEYSVCGRQQRALQLLNRVASSGYPESAIAIELIQQIASGKALK